MLKLFCYFFISFILWGTIDSAIYAQLFDEKLDYFVGSAPFTLVAEDFDGDNDIDLATGLSITPLATDGEGWISVIMNNGDGTFTKPNLYFAGDEPAVSSADFDNDGDIDLVSVDFSTNFIYIILNEGNGIFTMTDSFPSGGLSPNELCTPDLNGDGYFDLAVPLFFSNRLAIFFNNFSNGDSSFIGPVYYTVGNNPHSVVSADFDIDGDSDLVVTNNGSRDISVLLNDGNGGFPNNTTYRVGSFPQSLSLADYDGDGCLDIAVPNAGSTYATILYGNCDGTFGSRLDVTGCRPHAIVSADFDLDNDIDMAIGNAEGSCVNVSVLLNNGNGTFAPYFTLEAGHGPHQGVAKDFDKDGDLDLAFINYYDDVLPGEEISIFFNQTYPTTPVASELDFPKTFLLEQNYPNPFNPTTTIRIQIPEWSYVVIKVYDVLGNEIITLVNEEKSTGSYEVEFDATDYPSGIYFYRLQAGSFIETKKMILLK